jgi:phosphatidylglycerophosphatase A
MTMVTRLLRMPRRPSVTERPGGLAIHVATIGPIGAVPFAPGTLGAAVGVALTALIRSLPLGPPGVRGAIAALAAAVYGLGVWSAGKAEKALGVIDPGPVIIDEVAGQLTAFIFQPVTGWKMLFGGFLLFRFFDVLKPFPARRLEHLPGGWGIMTDDVAAGIYAGVALFLVGLAVR